jgi:hypothetical protein
MIGPQDQDVVISMSMLARLVRFAVGDRRDDRTAQRGGALLAQQFARDTLTPPRTVVERDDLEDGGVQIVVVANGYVVTSRRDDPEGPMGPRECS